MLDYIRGNDGTLCFFLDGQPCTITPSHPSYDKIVERLDEANKQFQAELKDMLSIRESIRQLTQGKVYVDIDEGVVQYDGVNFPDHGLVDRILRLVAEGHSFEPLVNMLEKLGSNPIFRSVMEAFPFITQQGLPITEDGDILAYKAVTSDYKDKWTKTIDNSIGSIVEVSRDDVCDDHTQACAPGLHVGSLSYINSYGTHGVDKFIVVKFSPADIVSVPSNESTDKMRVCRYQVVKDLEGNSLLEGEVYTVDGERKESARFLEAQAKGWFDQQTNEHWEVASGDNYDRNDEEYDDVEEEECDECGYPLSECWCEDLKY
jgi:hypothetical protein